LSHRFLSLRAVARGAHRTAPPPALAFAIRSSRPALLPWAGRRIQSGVVPRRGGIDAGASSERSRRPSSLTRYSIPRTVYAPSLAVECEGDEPKPNPSAYVPGPLPLPWLGITCLPGRLGGSGACRGVPF